ncbi:hypothetical protein ACJJI4_23915 (plasmid) [Microbulbifer sp. TRSA002]|uniref:hypothetical protein n=1 Tax=Microbulbifer sp. TRSA002 TaxID=3243382 RepID=UPI004039E115
MHRLKRRQRFYNALGQIILLFAGLVALIGYGLGPLLTGKQWQLASLGVHLASTITGLLLVWLGLKQAIFQGVQSMDTYMEKYWPYRLLRWSLFKFIGLITFLFSVVLLSIIDEEVDDIESSCDEGTVDEIWKAHPQHYYDKEPPNPLS